MSPPRPRVPAALTAAAFAPFGEVIDLDAGGGGGGTGFAINAGSTIRHDLPVAVEPGPGGRAGLALFRCVRPVTLPCRVDLLECHPLGSQAFVPLERTPFLVVVAPPGDVPDPDRIAVFRAEGGRGVNYRPGIWHAPLAALAAGTFLVIDRAGTGDNLREWDATALRLTVGR